MLRQAWNRPSLCGNWRHAVARRVTHVLDSRQSARDSRARKRHTRQKNRHVSRHLFVEGGLTFHRGKLNVKGGPQVEKENLSVSRAYVLRRVGSYPHTGEASSVLLFSNEVTREMAFSAE